MSLCSWPYFRGLLIAVAALAATPASAQMELKLIAPAAPGGGWDQTARSMQQALVASGAALGRTPIMENYFVIVGPREDPAKVAAAADPAASRASRAERLHPQRRGNGWQLCRLPPRRVGDKAQSPQRCRSFRRQRRCCIFTEQAQNVQTAGNQLL